MDDLHILPLVKDLLLEIGLQKKDISGFEESKSNLNKNTKSENLSKFYVESNNNSPKVTFQSSDVKALNLSPRYTPFSSKRVDNFVPPQSKKVNGRSVRKVKHDKSYSATSTFMYADNHKIRRYKKISKIFGCGIDELPCINTYLQDGTVVFIPEVVYELSNVILNDVSVDGIFRKAGSAQRQNNAKDIINSGQRLPDFIQAVDAACLLKFFLRSLPVPLLSANKIQLISKCLSLPVEKIEDGLMLSLLAIPKNQRHMLSYIFEVLHVVSAEENTNRMDSTNLAIVLAPNFLSSIFRRQKKGWASAVNEKDDVLSSTIAIVEALINMAEKIGRIPTCLEEKLKSIYSVESMESLASNSSKKKRRSGSLQRLLTGLRKAVQGPTSCETSLEPLFNSFKPKRKRRSVERVDNNSDTDTEVQGGVTKRKSIETDEGLNCKEMEIATPSPCIKRPRLSLETSRPPVLPLRVSRRQESHEQFDALVHTVQPKIMRSSSRDSSVHRRYSLRDRMIAPSVTPKRNFALADKKMTARRQSLRLAGISPCFNPLASNLPVRATHYIDTKRPPLSSQPVVHNCGVMGKNEPHFQSATLDQDQPMINSSMLRAKSDMSEVNPNISCINSGTPRRKSLTSCLDMVQSTYEAVKLESRNFDPSPCESLSRRLSKELKLRSRRSSEYKVQRSPSERRISKIRRYSKENLPQKSPALVGFEGSPYSIRRGKPNTLASGLPLLAKPLNPTDFKDCEKHLKLRTRSVSLIVNTSSEPYTSRELSFVGQKNPEEDPDILRTTLLNSHLSLPAESKLVTSVEKHLLKESKSCMPTSTFSSFDVGNEDHQWVPAKDAILDNNDFATPNKPILNLAQHRMSIDALKRQKKVTANVKLFNGAIQTPSARKQIVHTPVTNRGLTHTPAIKTTLRSSAARPPVFRTPRSRMTSLMNSNCFHGQSGFTPLPPKPFQPKRLLNPQSKPLPGPKTIPGSNIR